MADKRKKRPTAATASHYDQTSSHEFHVVNISGEAGAAAAPRRRSASAGRSESWMTKVTTAMSHHLFSGRRLSASRSTQVMPMLHASESVSHDRSDGSRGSGGGSSESAEPSRDRAHTLRLVSSEATLLHATGSLGQETARRPPPECPNVVCTIEADEFIGDEVRRAPSTSTCTTVNTIQVRTPRKVYPHKRSSDWDDDATTSLLTPVGGGAGTARRLRRSGGEEPAEPIVHTATPILKDFFNRSATSTQRERAQQRESRRRHHYKSSKERHDRLREQCQHDEHSHAEQTQREKINRLRKWNQQRRIQMRHEASVLKKSLAASRLSEQSCFAAERERWEHDFGAEMDTLGKAYRRAYPQDSGGGNARPVTVAGLAVPEAMSQIQRDAVSNTRRLKTAAPAGWSTAFEEFVTTEMKEHNVLHVEDANEVDDVFGDAVSEALTVECLLAERQEMARRIAQLERQVDAAKLGVVVDAADSIGREDGFFI